MLHWQLELELQVEVQLKLLLSLINEKSATPQAGMSFP
jgi:hypothetical protein